MIMAAYALEYELTNDLRIFRIAGFLWGESTGDSPRKRPAIQLSSRAIYAILSEFKFHKKWVFLRPGFDGITLCKQSNLKATCTLAYIMDKLCQTDYTLLRKCIGAAEHGVPKCWAKCTFIF